PGCGEHPGQQGRRRPRRPRGLILAKGWASARPRFRRQARRNEGLPNGLEVEDALTEEDPAMRLSITAALSLLACTLAACESEAERQADATEDRLEQQADASAAAAGDA